MASGSVHAKQFSSSPEVVVDRRAWIASVLRTAVGGVLLQRFAQSQVHDHSHTPATPDSSSSTPWTPKFLTAEQNQNLVALGERIIPGSAAACCNQVIDLVMTVLSKAHQDELTGALTTFDKAAREHGQSYFAELPPAQQDAILSLASTASAGSLHASFGVVKEWMVDTYWSSRQGMHELGWNEQVAWANYPACPHTDDSQHSSGTESSVSLR